MAELVITKENFEKEVLQCTDMPVLLDLWASWCGPCMRLAPVVAEIAEELEGKVKVGKINVDEQPELAMAFRAESIPLIVVMKNGKVVNGAVGVQPKEAILKMIEPEG